MKKLLWVIPCLTMTLNVAMAQSKPSLVDQILEGKTSLAREGSGVGGGVVYDSIIAWCDETGIILDEARQEAREVLGFQGSSVEALRSYHNGLTTAAQISQDSGNVTVSNSVTLKYIARGLKLSHILGVTGVISGKIDGTLSGQKKLDSLVSFFDWYLGYTKNIGEDLDKFLYIPYIIKKDCRGPECSRVPSVTTIELERKMYATSVDFLKQLEPAFVRMKTDQNSFYTNITADVYFKALSYVISETSKDLNESLFANAYSCQARRLQRMSDQVQLYVANRGRGEMDALKLNKYVLELREIIRALENKKCL